MLRDRGSCDCDYDKHKRIVYVDAPPSSSSSPRLLFLFNSTFNITEVNCTILTIITNIASFTVIFQHQLACPDSPGYQLRVYLHWTPDQNPSGPSQEFFQPFIIPLSIHSLMHDNFFCCNRMVLIRLYFFTFLRIRLFQQCHSLPQRSLKST
jgi:hypothetical protein